MVRCRIAVTCRFKNLLLKSAFSLPRDIVDTEPFQGGNLLKMLLGATFDWFDADEDVV